MGNDLLLNCCYNLIISEITQRENSKLMTEKVSEEDDIVVIYNRVPKTASTSFVGVAYDICKKNHFHVLHVNVSANSHVLSLNNQLQLASNITYWNAMKPALYHGHFAYFDFSKYETSFFIILWLVS